MKKLEKIFKEVCDNLGSNLVLNKALDLNNAKAMWEIMAKRGKTTPKIILKIVQQKSDVAQKNEFKFFQDKKRLSSLEKKLHKLKKDQPLNFNNACSALEDLSELEIAIIITGLGQELFYRKNLSEEESIGGRWAEKPLDISEEDMKLYKNTGLFDEMTLLEDTELDYTLVHGCQYKEFEPRLEFLTEEIVKKPETIKRFSDHILLGFNLNAFGSGDSFIGLNSTKEGEDIPTKTMNAMGIVKENTETSDLYQHQISQKFPNLIASTLEKGIRISIINDDGVHGAGGYADTKSTVYDWLISNRITKEDLTGAEIGSISTSVFSTRQALDVKNCIDNYFESSVDCKIIPLGYTSGGKKAPLNIANIAYLESDMFAAALGSFMYAKYPALKEAYPHLAADGLKTSYATQVASLMGMKTPQGGVPLSSFRRENSNQTNTTTNSKIRIGN
jgi:hypothetical protein